MKTIIEKSEEEKRKYNRPFDLDELFKQADTNKDKVVTEEEALALEKRLGYHGKN